MEEVIITFKKYKDTYQTRLENHLTEYEDYDELHFINSELDHYNNCYHTANVTKHEIYAGNDDYTFYKYIYYNDIENDPRTDRIENPLVRLMILDPSKSETNFYNLAESERLTVSFRKIIDFLQELEHYKTIEDIKKSSILSEFIKKEPELTKTIEETYNQNTTIQYNKLDWLGSELEFTELIFALYSAKRIGVGMHRNKVFEKLRDIFNIKDFDETDKIRDIKSRAETTKFITILETTLNNWKNKEV